MPLKQLLENSKLSMLFTLQVPVYLLCMHAHGVNNYYIIMISVWHDMYNILSISIAIIIIESFMVCLLGTALHENHQLLFMMVECTPINMRSCNYFNLQLLAHGCMTPSTLLIGLGPSTIMIMHTLTADLLVASNLASHIKV